MNSQYAINNGREVISGRTASAVLGVLFFILATALGAYVKIPVPGSPVPITLQTFFVILSAAVLGHKLGAFSQFGYVMLGAAGFPLFQGNYYSPAYLLGPTGGYLIGFIFAAWFIGHILDADTPGILKTATSFIIGCIIIYAFGIIWLIYLYRMTLIKAISIGALPFIPGDAVKISLAVIIYSSLAKRARAVFPRCQ